MKDVFCLSVNTDRLSLDRIIFIGRTFDEYMKMFNLNASELKGKNILDCPAGACAFGSQMKSSSINIKSCDIAYYFDKQSLYKKGQQDIEHAIENIEKAKHLYNWTYFKNTQELKNSRIQALENCYSDMVINKEDYIAAKLPVLPFADHSFDILLSAHFLFMYADQLDYEFHRACINEMLRVSKNEIRIFPIVDLKGEQYQYLSEILSYISDLGHETELIKVDYEFQKNAHTMMKITIRGNDKVGL